MKIGLVGATGLVGTEMLQQLETRSFPVEELRAFASPRSVGRRLPFAGREIVCEVLADGCFDGLDLVFVDVDEPISDEWSPRAAAAGAIVIDKSSAFRMNAEVPLVVAEVNPEDLETRSLGIVACPNCTTMVLLTALAPLHRAATIDRAVIASYQSVSGAGQPGMRELADQWTKGAGREDVFRRAATVADAIRPGEIWSKPIAGNVIPLAGSVDVTGYSSEERKLRDESRKILHTPDLRVSATCVRVPVYVGHAMAANVSFSRPLDLDEARAVLDAAPGVVLVDGGAGAPTPMEAAGIDPVLVGRLRQDSSAPNTLDLWVTGDNLRKGAALNAVQLAELMI